MNLNLNKANVSRKSGLKILEIKICCIFFHKDKDCIFYSNLQNFQIILFASLYLNIIMVNAYARLEIKGESADLKHPAPQHFFSPIGHNLVFRTCTYSLAWNTHDLKKNEIIFSCFMFLLIISLYFILGQQSATSFRRCTTTHSSFGEPVGQFTTFSCRVKYSSALWPARV